MNVYLSDLEASVDNLTNIRNETAPLLTTVNAKALAMDQAKFEFHLKMDPFSYRPTFDMAARLIGLDVTKTNDLVHTYGQFRIQERLVRSCDRSGGQGRWSYRLRQTAVSQSESL